MIFFFFSVGTPANVISGKTKDNLLSYISHHCNNLCGLVTLCSNWPYHWRNETRGTWVAILDQNNCSSHWFHWWPCFHVCPMQNVCALVPSVESIQSSYLYWKLPWEIFRHKMARGLQKRLSIKRHLWRSGTSLNVQQIKSLYLLFIFTAPPHPLHTSLLFPFQMLWRCSLSHPTFFFSFVIFNRIFSLLCVIRIFWFLWGHRYQFGNFHQTFFYIIFNYIRKKMLQPDWIIC